MRKMCWKMFLNSLNPSLPGTQIPLNNGQNVLSDKKDVSDNALELAKLFPSRYTNPIENG